MCDIFDKAVRRGKELGEKLGARTASYQGAVASSNTGAAWNLCRAFSPTYLAKTCIRL